MFACYCAFVLFTLSHLNMWCIDTCVYSMHLNGQRLFLVHSSFKGLCCNTFTYNFSFFKKKNANKSFIVYSDASSINWQFISGLDKQNTHTTVESVKLYFYVDTHRQGMWSSIKKTNYSDECSWTSS